MRLEIVTTRLSRLYSSGRRIAHNQWRILLKDGVGGNVASLRRFADNRSITGMFSTGLRAHVSKTAVTRWYRRNRVGIVVVAHQRDDLSKWLRELPLKMKVSLLVPPGQLSRFDTPHRGRVWESEAVQGVLDLRVLRRLLLQFFGGSDVIFLDRNGELPSAEDLMALQYAARRYELVDNRVGVVTPQLVSDQTGEVINGFEWDRRLGAWAVSETGGADYGQTHIPRYVLAAPSHALYVRAEVIRLDASDSDQEEAELPGQLRSLLARSWQQGWRTLAYPLVDLTSETFHVPAPSPADLAWRGDRNVRDSSGRLRIIYVLLATTISGGIRTVFEQTEHLLDLGHHVEIWSLDGPPDWTSTRTPIVSFENHRDLTDALASEPAIKVATWWETAQVVWLASVNTGVPVYYVQEFETWFYPDDPVARAAVAASYRLEMDHIAIAQYQADELEGIGVSATVISSAYDSSKFYLTGEPRATDTVMAVGRSFFQKNFAMTLAAWRSMATGRPKLLLYGFEPELARDPGIEYLVKPSDAQINELYNGATIFVQTSRHEGFSLPILEAMAAGCPVITTDSHGNRDFCEDGVNCVMVEQDDVAGLAAALDRLLGDSDLQDRLRLAGLDTAQRHTWRVVSERMQSHFSALA